MALISRIIGDCPGCGANQSYGLIDVYGTHVAYGCKYCRYWTQRELPKIRKKILYLDQFFFSHAYRGREDRFIDAANKIARLAELQLLVVPYSSIHEDETHQWTERDELLEFIKSTSRGHEFTATYRVEQTQILMAFDRWLAGESDEYQMSERDVLRDDIHKWESYFRIDVGSYIGDIDLIRNLKNQTLEGLVSLFDGWRKSDSAFHDDLQLELRDAGKMYFDLYMDYAERMAKGDFDALIDSPAASTIMRSMLHKIENDMSPEQAIEACVRFFVSDHFKQIPYQQISARIYATLKAMVKEGAYTNHERTLKRLSGFNFDVNHISHYAPYCDSFIMDQAMAEIVNKPTVGLSREYGVSVFSLNNWEDLFLWLDSLEKEMTEEHKAGVAEAYPHIALV